MKISSPKRVILVFIIFFIVSMTLVLLIYLDTRSTGLSRSGNVHAKKRTAFIKPQINIKADTMSPEALSKAANDLPRAEKMRFRP